MANWFWGVKYWTCNLYLTIDSGPVVVTAEDIAWQNAGVVAENERDLICTETVDGTPGLYLTGSGSLLPTYDVGFDFQINLFSAFGQNTISTIGGNPGIWDTDAIRYVDGLYYPQMVLRLVVAGDDVEPSDLVTYNDETFVSQTPNVMTFHGVTVPTYATSLGDITGLEFTPQEWWPYAPESDDSKPIYDTETGERIRANTVSD